MVFANNAALHADHLVRLESFIREAFIQRQHAVAVFFDLEKTYDCTWKYGTMKDLHQAGLRGRLPCFIEGFLKNRQFSVRLGACLSLIRRWEYLKEVSSQLHSLL